MRSSKKKRKDKLNMYLLSDGGEWLSCGEEILMRKGSHIKKKREVLGFWKREEENKHS